MDNFPLEALANRRGEQRKKSVRRNAKGTQGIMIGTSRLVTVADGRVSLSVRIYNMHLLAIMLSIRATSKDSEAVWEWLGPGLARFKMLLLGSKLARASQTTGSTASCLQRRYYRLHSRVRRLRDNNVWCYLRHLTEEMHFRLEYFLTTRTVSHLAAFEIQEGKVRQFGWFRT